MTVALTMHKVWIWAKVWRKYESYWLQKQRSVFVCFANFLITWIQRRRTLIVYRKLLLDWSLRGRKRSCLVTVFRRKSPVFHCITSNALVYYRHNHSLAIRVIMFILSFGRRHCISAIYKTVLIVEQSNGTTCVCHLARATPLLFSSSQRITSLTVFDVPGTREK